MNWKRILLGGLVAGLILNMSEYLLNGVVLASQLQGALVAHNLTFASWAMTAYVLTAFAYGFVLAWLYAAIRPRYGAGFGTTLIAAAALWTAADLLPTIGYRAMGLGAAGTYVITLAWGAAELVIAAGVAGYLYRESEASAAQAL